MFLIIRSDDKGQISWSLLIHMEPLTDFNLYSVSTDPFFVFLGFTPLSGWDQTFKLVSPSILTFLSLYHLPHLPLSAAEYDPPGYLYQPAEMNGHVLEYTTLSGSSRINGGVHGGYGHLPQGCHHLHHKLPNGLGLLNGTSSLFSPGHPHGHDGTLPHSTRDCEHPHPHHHHNVSAAVQTPQSAPNLHWTPCSCPWCTSINWPSAVFNISSLVWLNVVFVFSCQGGGMYTALPQTEPSDCMSCQNLCNNNRWETESYSY